jgi:hypothetical protein
MVFAIVADAQQQTARIGRPPGIGKPKLSRGRTYRAHPAPVAAVTPWSGPSLLCRVAGMSGPCVV